MININKIRKSQNSAYNAIKNSKLTNKFAHLYIIYASSYSNVWDFSHFLLMSFICLNNNELICHNCSNCISYKNGTFLDLIIIDTKNKLINKEIVLDSISKMSQRALNKSNKKVLIIHNIDKANSSATNSLLKFIEEPYENTLVIFTTYKYKLLNNTIKSRGQSIRLHGLKWQNLSASLQRQNINIEHANILASFYPTKKEAIDNYADDSKIIDDVISSIEHWIEHNFVPIQMWQKFHNEHMHLNIHILKLFFLDAHKSPNDSDLIFCDHKDFYNKVKAKEINYSKIIDAIIKFKKNIKANVGTEAAKAALFISIGDACG